jgi:hypothetical protein
MKKESNKKIVSSQKKAGNDLTEKMLLDQKKAPK